MRFVVFGPGHPFRGGIARTTTELVCALRRRDHSVTFLSPRRQYPDWLYPGGSGDRDPQACPKLEDTLSILDPMNPVAWPRGRRAALGERAEAWILPYWTWAWAGWWRYLLHGRRPPAVAVVHNPADHDAGRLQRAAARAVLSRCQGLFTHARVLADGLQAAHPGLPAASHPIPVPELPELPEQSAARQALGLPEGRRIAVFLGLIRPYKGVDLLLEAFSRLPAGSDWFLVVAGEPWGGLGGELLDQAAALGIEDRARFELRWLGEAEVPPLLAAADVLILPYRSGSQSAVAPQALGYGIPVVTSSVGGLSEVVRHGVNGLLVPPGDVDELAAAISSLDSERLEELATGARDSRGSLRWSDYAETLEGLIERVLAQ